MPPKDLQHLGQQREVDLVVDLARPDALAHLPPHGADAAGLFVDDDRIIELEIKLTHQDRLLEALNDVGIEQANQIDELRRAVAGLEKGGGGAALPIGPAAEKPPHY